ncbi:MAG: CCA tRNA nucleotidyltransferase [Salinarimonadaceae bacterium]|nr:MAG: CCA tRNA nucleotidyltransferase [Salinarimonadaceae bacterium]
MTPAHDGVARVLADAALRRILTALDGDGEETRVVGGAVRNALMGLPVRDIDLTTTAAPQETTRRARAAGLKVVPTGIEHGTVTVIVDGRPFEVTTLREDVETDGRFAVVRFGRDFAMDARRRDFTINALSVGADGEVRDYVGGLEDVAARRVRFIGAADNRIREDYLRILRFFRFFAEYAVGPIDQDGLRAAIAGREGLARLSRERIRAEFVRLLAAPRALETARLLAHSGLLDRLTGGVGDIGRLGRVVANAGSDATLRLAAFDVMSEADVNRLTERLRLSNAEAARLLGYARALAAMRGRHAVVDSLALRRLSAEWGARAVMDAAAALRGEPSPVFAPDALAALEAGLDDPVMPLAGRDLVAAGLRPGPDLGQALEQARAAWIEGGCLEGEGERERLLALALSEVTQFGVAND